MRPPVPDLARPRSRKSSSPDQRWIDPRSAVPATFFLARSHQHPDESPPGEFDPSEDSMFGVQSLDETVQQANLAASQWDSEHTQSVSDPLSPVPHHVAGRDVPSPPALRKSTITPFDSLHLTHPELSLPSSRPVSPCPLTPLNFDAPDDPASLPSSPKSTSNQSMRHLDEISIADDLSSQAIASGEEDDEPRPPPRSGPDSTSQLIMPSIRMPSRRPFTDRGKAMGRLKVLVAGFPGSGKTSLVKAIVQTCEDIVHVDPFPTPSASKPSISSIPHNLPPAVSEIYASTKPYPVWWSDLEDSRVLRRRKCGGDLVLERNICFVDTSTNSSTRTGQTDAIIHYMHQQLVRATTSLNRPNPDFQNMLAGNGGAQVDAILFLISEETLSVDIECMRKLSEWTNVIPVIPKSDLLVPDQLCALKSAFHSKVQEAAVKPFLFGEFSGDTDHANGRLPFATSSAKSSDDDVMDASILMSPDYVQPLVASELTLLTQKLFDRENMVWIRHLAAKKLTQRQSTVQSGPMPFVPGGGGRVVPSYTMARISDCTRHEEKLAQVQLARWASNLQQSLQNERERYAAIARGERAVWLTERLGECVVDGSLVPITQTPGFCGLRAPAEKAGALLVRASSSGQNMEYHLTPIIHQDPLGLVRWAEGFKQRGWALIQIVGSFGVVGGLALWLAKSWGLPSRNLSDWQIDWCSPSQ